MEHESILFHALCFMLYTILSPESLVSPTLIHNYPLISIYTPLYDTWSTLYENKPFY